MPELTKVETTKEGLKKDLEIRFLNRFKEKTKISVP